MSWGELLLKSASSTFTGYFLIVSAVFILYGLTSTNCLLKSSSEEILTEELVALPSLCLIVFGILILMFITLGCCGVCREIPYCIETYSILMALLASFQVALGLFCLVRFSSDSAQLSDTIDDGVFRMYSKYDFSPFDLDSAQTTLGCCGVSGPFNWISDNRTIPLTCCQDMDMSCTITSPSRYTEGCSTMLFSYITTTNFIIGWSLIIVAITEVVAAMMGIGLSCAFWRSSRVVWM